MIIDSHQHFWDLSRGGYDWPNENVAPIFRNFGPDDLAPELRKCGVSRTILVQAIASVVETEFLCDVADSFGAVAGVVGWVDLAAADAIVTLNRVNSREKLVGIRPMLQNIEQTEWILQDSVQSALSHLEQLELCFDALIQPRHLPVIRDLAMRRPGLNIVVDHMAKPKMTNGSAPDNDWVDGIVALSACPNVYCKLSGMVTQAGSEWSIQTLRPFAHIVLDVFGPERVMFGSDWPVVNLAAKYTTWFDTVQELISALSSSEKSLVLGKTATRFYGL